MNEAGNGRDGFFDTLRRALGSGRPKTLHVPRETALADDAAAVRVRAQGVGDVVTTCADALCDELERMAVDAGWTVVRVSSLVEAAGYVERLVRNLEVTSLVRSRHDVIERMCVEEALALSGVEVTAMSLSDGDQVQRGIERMAIRSAAIEADIGITGVDYAIAETGSCVLLGRTGVSRLVGLLPPVYVAVVEKGQVLPSLDELFTLRRHGHLEGDDLGYMNIVTGPSRSADIEQTIVKGVHGPGDVHMLLVDCN